MTTTSTRRAAVLAGLLSCALLGACGESGADAHGEGGSHDGHAHAGHDHAEPAAPAEAGPPRWSYEGVLGVIAEVPEAGKPMTAFKIHHEHIPGFINPRTGEVARTSEGVPGMRAMIMEMPPGEGVDVSAFAVGDKVRFTFGVWDQPRVSWKLTAIEKVDAATEISFDDKP